jgi:hypothetical protein
LLILLYIFWLLLLLLRLFENGLLEAPLRTRRRQHTAPPRAIETYQSRFHHHHSLIYHQKRKYVTLVSPNYPAI